MKTSFILSMLLLFHSHAQASGPLCSDLFSKTDKINSLVDHFYFYNPKISDLVHALQQRGLNFEFWDPSGGKLAPLQGYFVEPQIQTLWKDGNFDLSKTTLRLPVFPEMLFGSTNYLPKLRSYLIKIYRIFELQNNGVLFDQQSLEYNKPVIVTGSQTSGRILSDMTLETFRLYFSLFPHGRLVFDGNESTWLQADIPHQVPLVQEPGNRHNNGILLRDYFFNDLRYLEEFPKLMESKVFLPHGVSLVYVVNKRPI